MAGYKNKRQIRPQDAEYNHKGIKYSELKSDDGGKQIYAEVIEETIYSLMNIKEGKDLSAVIGIVPQDILTPDDQNDITEGGTYISDDLDLPIPGILVYSSRGGMYKREVGEELFPKTFTEIDFEEDSQHMNPPTINDKLGQDGIQARNGKWYTKKTSDIASRLGEDVIYQVQANHHLHLLVEAYNYLEEDPEGEAPDGKENTEGMSYEWRFSSGEENYDINVIEKVVSTKQLLSIEDAQRAHIGRYTCHVSNAYGKVKTWTLYVDIFRPGEVKEQKLTLSNGEEVLTGQYTWVANDNSSGHDEKFSEYDDKWLFTPGSNKSQWTKCYWDTTSNWWKEETTNDSFIFDHDFYPSNTTEIWEEE